MEYWDHEHEVQTQNGERAMKKRGWSKDLVSKISVLVKKGRMKAGKGAWLFSSPLQNSQAGQVFWKSGSAQRF
jgi:hypothetical protein